MAATSTVGDKIFKVITATLALTTVVSLGSLGVNIFLNTGSRRKPTATIAVESTTDLPKSTSTSTTTTTTN